MNDKETKYRPLIIWEKWINPYGLDTEDYNWTNETEDDIIDTEYSESNIKYTKIRAIATSMGIVPFNEHTDCSKIFNFWIGHTNFSITKHIAEIIESIDGVETLDIFTRYRFRISIGKCFNDADIMSSINNTIYKQYD